MKSHNLILTGKSHTQKNTYYSAFLVLKVLEQVKIIYGVRNQGNDYPWKVVTGRSHCPWDFWDSGNDFGSHIGCGYMNVLAFCKYIELFTFNKTSIQYGTS